MDKIIAVDINGNYGVPSGRTIEISGNPSDGKTTVLLHLIAEIQRIGGIPYMIETEHAFDPNYARSLKVNTDDLLLSQPETIEEALSLLETFILTTRAFDRDVPMLIAFDSLAAAPVKAELEGDYGDATMGSTARLLSQAMRKLTSIISANNVYMVFTNQIKEKIGVVWGKKTQTFGGRAVRYHASVRVELVRTGNIKEGEKIVGAHIKAKAIKNKLIFPFQETTFDIKFGEGINFSLSLLDMLVQKNVVKTPSKGWFEYSSNQFEPMKFRKGDFNDMINQNADLKTELEAQA